MPKTGRYFEQHSTVRQHLVAAGVYAVVSLIIFLWFGGDYLVGVGDSYRALDRYRFLRTVDSGWRGEQNTGSYEYLLEYHLPASFLYFPLTFLGVGPVAISKIWLYCSVFFPGLFMYLFLRRFWKDSVSWQLCIVGGLFYIFNPVSLMRPFGGTLTKYPVYLALPLITYLIVYIFDVSSWLKKVQLGILLAFATILIVGSFGNVAELAPAVVVLPVFLGYELVSHKDFGKHIALFGGIAVLSFLIHFWWLFSAFLSMYILREALAEGVAKFGGTGPNLFNALRLFGFWALLSVHDKVPYYLYGKRYFTLQGIVSTYLIPVLVFSSLFFKQARKVVRSKVLLFLIVALVGVFLVKGPNPPFGAWYDYLYDNVPLFRMFREPYAKFTLISLFAYTVLLAYSLEKISAFIKKYMRHALGVVSLLFILLVVYITYPMFRYDWINDHTNGTRKQFRVKVPDYWYDFEQYSADHPFAARVYATPKMWYYRKSFIWESGFNGNPLELYMHGNWTYYRWEVLRTRGDLMIEELYGVMEKYNLERNPVYVTQFLNLVRLLNIGYHVQMNDFDWLCYGLEYIPWSTYRMEQLFKDFQEYYDFQAAFGKLTFEYLSSIPHVRGGDKIYRFDEDPTTEDYYQAYVGRNALELYKIKEPYVLDKLYIPSVVEVGEELEDMLVIAENPEYVHENLVVVSPEDATDFEDVSFGEVTVEANQLNEARYVVTLSGFTDKPFPLVFSETYSPGWKLARKCNWLYCSDFIDAPQYRVTYYANGWLIDPLSGEETFYVAHEAESRLRIGLVVSGTVVALSVAGYLAIGVLRKRDLRS